MDLSLTKSVDRTGTLLNHEHHTEESSRLISTGIRKGLIRDNQFSKFGQGGLLRATKADRSSKDCSRIQVRQSAPREILEVFTLASYKCSPLLNQNRETGTDSEANRLYRGNPNCTTSSNSERPAQATDIKSTIAKRPNGTKHNTARNVEIGKEQNFPRHGLDTIRKAQSSKKVHRDKQEAQNLWVTNYGNIVGLRVRTCKRHGLHLLERIHKIILSRDIESPGLSVRC